VKGRIHPTTCLIRSYLQAAPLFKNVIMFIITDINLYYSLIYVVN